MKPRETMHSASTAHPVRPQGPQVNELTAPAATQAAAKSEAFRPRLLARRIARQERRGVH